MVKQSSMMLSRSTSWRIILAATAILAVGCTGQRRIKPPSVDPTAAAQRAIEMLDTDQDGSISFSETDSSPGLASAKALYDADGNEKLSAQEIADRIRSWRSNSVAMAQLSCKVTRRGKPLSGADVRLIPAKYLGDEIKPAVGTTDNEGNAIVTIDENDLPPRLRGIPAVHYGTYRVEITHSDVELPAKYNSATTLGHEIAHDCGKPYASFDLD